MASKFSPFLLFYLFGTVVQARHYRFGLLAKFINNDFFDVARDGCVDRARQLERDSNWTDTLECVYIGHTTHSEVGHLQAEAILQALNQSQVDNTPFDGLSLSVTNGDDLKPVYEEIERLDIPLVTFDSDDANLAASGGRVAYIGTDNKFLGSQLSKVLQKLQPGGGNYAVLSTASPNLNERVHGVQEVLRNDSLWLPYDRHVPGNKDGYVDYGGDNEQGIVVMKQILEDNPNIDAFIATTAVAMGYPKWGEFVQNHSNTLFITADDFDFQLAYLKVGKVHGLVGQMPYEMGKISMDVLYDIVKGNEVHDFYGTNVLEHLVVPLVLPPLTVEDNRLPVWAFVVGVFFMSVVVSTAVLFSMWTYWNRANRIVQMAQPEFLITIAVGCIIFASALLPLSLERVDTEGNTSICMTTPWLLCLGFTVIFATLWAKTFRAYHIVQASRRFRRTSLTATDVAKPLAVMLAANVIVLTVWSALDPLSYTRRDSPGTDEWNRVMATYGQCESRNPVPYVLVLAVLNIGVLLIANYQAWKARKLDNDFQEFKYIAIAMSSMLQVVAVGAPVLMLIRDNALAWFLTFALVIFFIAFGILCLMFAPKIQATQAPPAESAEKDWNGKSTMASTVPSSTRNSSITNIADIRMKQQMSAGMMSDSSLKNEGSAEQAPGTSLGNDSNV